MVSDHVDRLWGLAMVLDGLSWAERRRLARMSEAEVDGLVALLVTRRRLDLAELREYLDWVEAGGWRA